MDKKSLTVGIIFLLGSAYCLFYLLTKEFESFALTGLIIFALIGLAFIRRCKSR
ncbi:MAG: hypothetical protein ACK5MV_08995 [Aminipila sp.]